MLVGLVMMLLVLNILGEEHELEKEHHHEEHGHNVDTHVPVPISSAIRPKLPVISSYNDVFKPGSGGKVVLGTSGATCWARGGICVHIKRCPSLRIASVPGCAWGYKVCCLVHSNYPYGGPTVNYGRRRTEIPTILQLEDLGSSLQIVAERNSMLLSYMSDSDQDDNEEVRYHIDMNVNDKS